ncbi:MAG: hypothetical protein LBR80_12965 [Deltaproteobacteria bacterium]|jgi:hypothetical protein|nr:hypothetical protein [Deltaproteobacteria bacterium]
MAPTGAVYLNIDDQKPIVDRQLAAMGLQIDWPTKQAAKSNLVVKHLQGTDIDFRDRKWATFLLKQATWRRLKAAGNGRGQDKG